MREQPSALCRLDAGADQAAGRRIGRNTAALIETIPARALSPGARIPGRCRHHPAGQSYGRDRLEASLRPGAGNRRALLHFRQFDPEERTSNANGPHLPRTGRRLPTPTSVLSVTSIEENIMLTTHPLTSSSVLRHGRSPIESAAPHCRRARAPIGLGPAARRRSAAIENNR